MKGKKITDNVIVNVLFDINEKKFQHLLNIKLDNEHSLGKLFKDFIRLKNIRIELPYHIYLLRNNILKEFDKKELVKDADIKTGDKIIITDKKKELKSENKLDTFGPISTRSNAIIYETKTKHKRSIKNTLFSERKKKNLSLILFVSFLLLILFLMLGIILYIIFSKKKNSEKISKINENKIKRITIWQI